MPFTRMWSERENAKLVKIVKQSDSIEEAHAACKAVFPKDNLSRDAIARRLRRITGGGWTENLKSREEGHDPGIDRLVALSRGGKRTLEELCDALDASPARVRALVTAANVAGFRVACTGNTFGLQPTSTGKQTRSVVMPPGKEHVILVASDIHVGSRWFLRNEFQDHIRRGFDAGARVCLVPGDILDGCYDHSRWEESHHGFEEQAAECARVFPRIEGLRYVGITGNHDQTFEHRSGLSVATALPQRFREAGRTDLEILGARGAFIRLGAKGERGLLVEMWHPLKGPAYALSYKMQKHIEGYQVGQKPDVLLTGHWHQACYFTQRGVHALSCGTFHGGQSDFGKALGGAPAIGGWTLRYSMTKEGTIRKFAPEWNAYFESEHVREAGLT